MEVIMVEDSKRKLYDGYQINDFRELINVRYTMFKDKNAFEYRLKPDSEIIKVTYADYINDIKALGTALLNLGLEKKRIALIAPNRYEWCVSYLAVTTSNIVVVPLDKSLPDNEIESLIIRSKVDGVIFDKKYFLILFVQQYMRIINKSKILIMSKLEKLPRNRLTQHL